MYDEDVADLEESDFVPEPRNIEDIRKWETDNEQFFSVVRLTITGAPRSVLLLQQSSPNSGPRLPLGNL